MKLLLDRSSFQGALSAVDSLARFMIGVGDFSTTGTEDVLLETTADGEIIMEYAKNGLYVKTYVTGEILDPGKIVMNVRYIYGIDFSAKLVELDYSEGNRLHFKSGRLKGEIDVHQDFNLITNGKPVNIVKPTIDIRTDILKNACKLITFMSHDPAVSGTSGTGLPLRIQISGKVLTISTNDHMCGAVSYSVLDKETPDVNFVLPLDFIQRLLSLTQAEVLSVGIDESTFRVLSSDIDVIHPVQQFEVAAVEQEIEEDCRSDNKATGGIFLEAVINPSETAAAIHEVASLIVGVFPVDAEAFLKFVPAKKRCYVNVMSSHGEANSSFDLKDCRLTEGDTFSVKVSCWLIEDFLTLIKSETAVLRTTKLMDRLYIHSEDDHADYMIFTIV